MHKELRTNTDSNIANTYDAQAELTKYIPKNAVARQNNPQES